MTDQKKDMGELLDQVRNGSEQAGREFVERFGPYLLKVIRRKLDKRLRSKFDSIDFVQAVWASFFAIPPGDFHYEGAKALEWFLIRVAQNKMVEEVRLRLGSEKFDVKRERPLHFLNSKPRKNYDRTPTPSEIAIARDEWEKLKKDEPAHYQEILESRGEGYTMKEIADHLDVSEKTVQRVVERFRRRMKQ